MNIYNSNMNNKAYTCLNRLTIARITSGKRISAMGYTTEQLLLVQRLANRLNSEKEIVIAYNK